jgi:DNA-binding response OmpR family regulator
MNILVAEDNQNMQGMIRQYLIDRGNTVDCVSSGKAVYLLGSMNYDLIVLDVNMPNWDGISGIELAKAFGNESKVLLITGDPESARGCKFKSLIKPFMMDRLQEEIDVLMKENNNF